MAFRLLVGVVLVCLTFSSWGNAQTGINTDLPLIFQSSFEPTAQIVSRQSPRFVGKDETLPEKNDWEADISRFARTHAINTTGGNDSQRFAQIIPEPGKPDNHVMHFPINEGWLNGNSRLARVQTDLYGIRTGVKEFYQTVRIYLPEDMLEVKKYPQPIHWLSLLEIWNNITWSQSVPHGFRVTLGMGKPTREESDLTFILDAQDCELFENGRQRYMTIWSERNHNIKVSIGEWFTLHYYFKEGNAATGRFIVLIATERKKNSV